MAETWYEIVCFVVPQIVKRLVTSETVCYVFHTSGRKAAKEDGSGNVNWHKTFEEAKEELIRRGKRDITVAKARLTYAEGRLTEIQALEESCSKNS